METKHKVAVGGASTAAVLALAASIYIPHWEGTDLVAHHNSFDPKGVITWCNGITNYDDKTVKVGTHFTKEECAQKLTNLLPRYWDPLLACIHVPMPLHRSNAFLSASVNLGPGRVCKSPMVKYINQGNVTAACNAFKNYTRAAGVVLPGLENRRFKDRMWSERTWCLRED